VPFTMPVERRCLTTAAVDSGGSCGWGVPLAAHCSSGAAHLDSITLRPPHCCLAAAPDRAAPPCPMHTLSALLLRPPRQGCCLPCSPAPLAPLPHCSQHPSLHSCAALATQQPFCLLSATHSHRVTCFTDGKSGRSKRGAWTDGVHTLEGRANKMRNEKGTCKKSKNAAARGQESVLVRSITTGWPAAVKPGSSSCGQRPCSAWSTALLCELRPGVQVP
jgi:hypothetical protein